jgi:hypothetical protein
MLKSGNESRKTEQCLPEYNSSERQSFNHRESENMSRLGQCVGTTREDFEVDRVATPAPPTTLIWPIQLKHKGQAGFLLQGLPDSDLTPLQKGKGLQLSNVLTEMEAERNLDSTTVTNLFSKV